MTLSLDMNCDMGESFGAWPMGQDERVMPLISSANIACGYHAGDASTMRKTSRRWVSLPRMAAVISARSCSFSSILACHLRHWIVAPVGGVSTGPWRSSPKGR